MFKYCRVTAVISNFSFYFHLRKEGRGGSLPSFSRNIRNTNCEIGGILDYFFGFPLSLTPRRSYRDYKFTYMFANRSSPGFSFFHIDVATKHVSTRVVSTYFHNSGFNGTSNTSRAIVLHENITKLCTSEKYCQKLYVPVTFYQCIFHRL